MTTTERLNTREAREDGDFVRLSRKDAEDALRLLRLLSRNLTRDIPSTIDRTEFARIARAMLDQRQERFRLLPPEMFGEPAWDILLQLYVHGERPPSALGEVAQIGAIPRTTVARWVQFLEERELVQWRVEGGLESLQLTDRARRTLDSYFCHILAEGH